MSTINAFEARFGDKEGALAMLDYPVAMKDFFRRLSIKADLPDTPPTGTYWEPFVSGGCVGDFYVVSITSPDHNAIRPGMVATRMLALPILDFIRCGNLEAILEYLETPTVQFLPETSIEFGEVKSVQANQDLVNCVATSLVQKKRPVAVLGQPNFRMLLPEFWGKLPSGLRKVLSFGFSFTPSDIRESKLDLVAVPDSCKSRWSGYESLCSAEKSAIPSQSNFLFDSRQGSPLQEFLDDLQVEVSSFDQLRQFVRVFKEWNVKSSDEQGAYALLRSLGTLILDPNQGKIKKQEAMAVAIRHLKNANSDAILAQRSVKAVAFENGAALLGKAIGQWIKQHYSLDEQSNVEEISKVVRAISNSQSKEWVEWVRSGLKSSLRQSSAHSARFTWELWNQPETFSETSKPIPLSDSAEDVFVDSMPKNVDSKLDSELQLWCIERQWLKLLGCVTASLLGFEKSIRLLVEQKDKTKKQRAIDHVCGLAKSSEVWELAFQLEGDELDEHAVNAAFKDRSLWIESTEDLTKWLTLFDSAVRKQRKILSAENSDLLVARIFEAWDEGSPLSENILKAMNESGHLDFFKFPNRKSVWRRIPAAFLHHAKTNTLNTWKSDFFSRPQSEVELENDLVTHCLQHDFRNNFFDKVSSKHLAANGIVLLDVLGNEELYCNWLENLVKKSCFLDSAQAAKVGEKIAKHNWINAARLAKSYQENRNRKDLEPLWENFNWPSTGIFDSLFNLFTKNPQSKLPPTMKRHTKVDAMFITALSEEFSAIVEHLVDHRETTERGTIYTIGRFHSQDIECSVAVVQTGMGNSKSAAATERAIATFTPDYAFFVGVAGGLRDDLSIGDVVAADKVYGYESGKSDAQFKPRPEGTPVSHAAVQRAHAVVRDKRWRIRSKNNPQQNQAPAALVKPIASGEKVLVSEQSIDLKRLRETYTDAHAVAMEEHGFAVAIQANPDVCFAVVRGISDLIENKAESDASGSHDIASRNAAAFAFELLFGLVKANS